MTPQGRVVVAKTLPRRVILTSGYKLHELLSILLLKGLASPLIMVTISTFVQVLKQDGLKAPTH